MSPPSRALGSFEHAQVETSQRFAFNLVTVVRISGRLREEVLRESLDQLQRRHALLRCRIVGRPGRRSFELEEVGAIPLVVHDGTDGESGRSLIESELCRGFDGGAGPLLRCTLRSSPAAHGDEIHLAFHHVIADAQAVLRLVAELMSLCGGEPQLPEPPGDRLPPTAEDLFPAAFQAPRCWPASARFLGRQLGDEVSYRWHRRRQANPPGAPPFACQILTLELPKSETRALVRATRRRRVGMMAALNAAMLLAVVRRRHAGRLLPHRYFAMPDLRPYLDPPVAPDVVGSYISMMRFSLPVSDNSQLWDLAARIHHQIDRETRRGGKFLAARWGAFSMRVLLGQSTHRMSTIAMNYAGAPPLPLEYGRLRIERLHAFVSNFPLGPEYTAQMRIFRGRLLWDIVTLDVDMDRAQALEIAEEMRRVLNRAAQERE